MVSLFVFGFGGDGVDLRLQRLRERRRCARRHTTRSHRSRPRCARFRSRARRPAARQTVRAWTCSHRGPRPRRRAIRRLRLRVCGSGEEARGLRTCRHQGLLHRGALGRFIEIARCEMVAGGLDADSSRDERQGTEDSHGESLNHTFATPSSATYAAAALELLRLDMSGRSGCGKRSQIVGVIVAGTIRALPRCAQGQCSDNAISILACSNL